MEELTAANGMGDLTPKVGEGGRVEGARKRVVGGGVFEPRYTGCGGLNDCEMWKQTSWLSLCGQL